MTTTKLPNSISNRKKCSFARCRNYVYEQEICRTHYYEVFGRKQCSVDGCNEVSYCRSWCCNHYERWRVHGNPLITTSKVTPGDTPEERFWARVIKTDTCWIWTKAKRVGYGILHVEGNLWGAHQYAWFLTYGYRSKMFILHSCDTPACVNPAHLREGTPADNSQDMTDRGRQAKGGRNGKAKLTEECVLEIKRLLKEGAKMVSIAKKFGVAHPTISNIKHNHCWKHIEV